MKILHTADLHLKHKHPFTRMEEGRMWDRMCEEKLKILRKIPSIVKKYDVDVVAIAGDVFDTSNPPEALKAEFCKVLNELKGTSVDIIPGRPGDHDFVSENNYVLMDLREAYKESHVVIWNEPTVALVPEEVFMAHLMMEGISDKFRDTVELSNSMFKGFKIVLLGDYHNFWIKKYAGKIFTYSGAPYPNRFGESNHSMNLITLGKNPKIQRIQLPAYKLIEYGSFNEEKHLSLLQHQPHPYVVKFKMRVEREEMRKLLSRLQAFKRKVEDLEKERCMDMVWDLGVGALEAGKVEGKKLGLLEMCREYISENARYPQGTLSVFKKMEAEV